MRLKIKDLLEMEGKKCKSAFLSLDGDLNELISFETPNDYQLLPDLYDYLDERDLAQLPKTYETHNIGRRVPKNDNNTIDDIEDIIDVCLSLPVTKTDYDDYSILKVCVEQYNGKPVMVRLLGINLEANEIYYMNKETLEQFRHDILYGIFNQFNPKKAETDVITFCGGCYDKDVQVVDFNKEPFAKFDSESDIDSNLVKAVFKQLEVDSIPCIPLEIIHQIIGFPLDDSWECVDPLPLTAECRLSLSLRTPIDDISDCDWLDSIWSLNLDDVPVIAFMVTHGNYVMPEDVYIINNEKYPELQQLIRELCVPKFAEISEDKFVSEDDEIEIKDTEFITHVIEDGNLVSIVNVEKYKTLDL